jgi:signal transduction histidine kinase
LIADISHELNTPLSIMRLEAQGMTDGMQTPEEAARNIQREIDLLSGLITDLELIAEADQLAIQLVKEPVAVADFLTEITGRWQSEANTQSIQLQLTLESLPPTVDFDSGRMW